jgi:hypothetical protein
MRLKIKYTLSIKGRIYAKHNNNICPAGILTKELYIFLSGQHMTCFCFKVFENKTSQKLKHVESCHMLKAKPSTYQDFEQNFDDTKKFPNWNLKQRII